MTKLLLASVATLALGSAAQAQTAPGPWTGFYAGVHGGGVFDDRLVGTAGSADGNVANVTGLARPHAAFLDRGGSLYGGQVGYNVQRGMIAGGIELDGTRTDSKGTTTYLSPVAIGAATAGTRSDFQQKTNYLASARARLGLANERVFAYGTGGYATGEVVNRANFANSAGALQFQGSKAYQPSGWVAGGGIEYALAPTVNFFHMRGPTVRVEYLHYDLGDKTINVAAIPGVGAGAYASTFKNTADVVRGAVNVKF